ncbi:hypothetical protein CEXT_77061 [Caerostris extrusa]|uniref:Uncharacterized protein n=1 Tax=Caerostris extrusa TaxID=172846 RepID=A0AAV4MXN7_CAEEX|nr:hypothetical protein CEXT_77061 [Caerostris extrusa]
MFLLSGKRKRGVEQKKKSIVGHSFPARFLPALKNANGLFYDPRTKIVIGPKLKHKCSGGSSLASAAVHLQWWLHTQMPCSQNIWSNYQKCICP